MGSMETWFVLGFFMLLDYNRLDRLQILLGGILSLSESPERLSG